VKADYSIHCYRDGRLQQPESEVAKIQFFQQPSVGITAVWVGADRLQRIAASTSDICWTLRDQLIRSRAATPICGVNVISAAVRPLCTLNGRTPLGMPRKPNAKNGCFGCVINGGGSTAYQRHRHEVDWGGHVYPTLPEVDPEIDANTEKIVFFYRGPGHVWCLIYPQHGGELWMTITSLSSLNFMYTCMRVWTGTDSRVVQHFNAVQLRTL